MNKYMNLIGQNAKKASLGKINTKIKKQRCILIRATFLKTKNIAATARKLGVSRTTVYKHIND